MTEAQRFQAQKVNHFASKLLGMSVLKTDTVDNMFEDT